MTFVKKIKDEIMEDKIIYLNLSYQIQSIVLIFKVSKNSIIFGQ